MCKSEKSHARLDGTIGHKRADKIISILAQFVDLKSCNILDIGTGSGHIAQDIGKKCKSTTSVDINDERIVKSGFKFKKVNDEHLPFADNSFDVVISNHVIEHIPNQKVHISEIHRVLKKEGILYLATPNKHWIVDPHYKLPLISWFSRRSSSFYLKLLKNKSWDIYPLSYKNLKELAKNNFWFHNLTLEIIKNPQQYKLDIYVNIQPLMKLIPHFLLKLLNPIVPTYILILIKNKSLKTNHKL